MLILPNKHFVLVNYHYAIYLNLTIAKRNLMDLSTIKLLFFLCNSYWRTSTMKILRITGRTRDLFPPCGCAFIARQFFRLILEIRTIIDRSRIFVSVENCLVLSNISTSIIYYSKTTMIYFLLL